MTLDDVKLYSDRHLCSFKPMPGVEVVRMFETALCGVVPHNMLLHRLSAEQ